MAWAGVGRSRAQPCPEELYRQMCRIRCVEQAAAHLWHAGLISGEMHLGTGEEAVAAGVLAHLEEGDALAADHRSTPPLVARGVDPEAILRECLGDEHGLDGGRAGHMHLMSREHLAAASGIVGSTAPLACGFGLAAQLAGEGRIAVAFFGDGAINEGMLMESLNLAVVWALPVVFVCKDNRWSINTRSRSVTGRSLGARARGFGLPVIRVDGADVVAVWRAAERAVRRARRGHGPTFVLADVDRPDGHFLGDKMLDVASHPKALGAELRPLLAAVRAKQGAPVHERMQSLAALVWTIGGVARDRLRPGRDPLERAQRRLTPPIATRIEQSARDEIGAALRSARAGVVQADA